MTDPVRTVRMSDEDWLAVCLAAHESGVSASAYIRDACLADKAASKARAGRMARALDSIEASLEALIAKIETMGLEEEWREFLPRGSGDAAARGRTDRRRRRPRTRVGRGRGLSGAGLLRFRCGLRRRRDRRHRPRLAVIRHRWALRLPIKTISEANRTTEHWAQKADRVSNQRLLTRAELKRSGWPPFDGPATIRLTRVSPTARKMDDDNLPRSLKAIRDAIASAWGEDDSPDSPLSWEYEQTKGGGYAVHVVAWATPPMSDSQVLDWIDAHSATVRRFDGGVHVSRAVGDVMHTTEGGDIRGAVYAAAGDDR